MASGAPSMAALKQIGDILYELKEHPQFQTDITNAAMELRITDPADLRALIEARLKVYHAHLGETAKVASTPKHLPRLDYAVAGLAPSAPSAPAPAAGDAAERLEHSLSPAQAIPAAEPVASSVQVTTPIARTASGFMGSASTGGIDFFAPQDLPDVRPRAAVQPIHNDGRGQG